MELPVRKNNRKSPPKDNSRKPPRRPTDRNKVVDRLRDMKKKMDHPSTPQAEKEALRHNFEAQKRKHKVNDYEFHESTRREQTQNAEAEGRSNREYEESYKKHNPDYTQKARNITYGSLGVILASSLYLQHRQGNILTARKKLDVSKIRNLRDYHRHVAGLNFHGQLKKTAVASAVGYGTGLAAGYLTHRYLKGKTAGMAGIEGIITSFSAGNTAGLVAHDLADYHYIKYRNTHHKYPKFRKKRMR